MPLLPSSLRPERRWPFPLSWAELGSDEANALAVDSAGNVWLAGSTSSTNFPLVNALQALLAGGKDVFVATLNASGNQLLYSSYVGGGSDDSGLAIGIDNKGSEMVGGITQSSSFPSTAGVLQPLFGGSYDGFIFKLQTGICPYSLSANALNAAGGGAAGTITAIGFGRLCCADGKLQRVVGVGLGSRELGELDDRG